MAQRALPSFPFVTRNLATVIFLLLVVTSCLIPFVLSADTPVQSAFELSNTTFDSNNDSSSSGVVETEAPLINAHLLRGLKLRVVTQAR
ncbi:hypothetical protein BC937DRAFT_86242 [Endogone sp. FLAS-F59071]|nr:hypothetical protein BC937DRAFT_86242 [Endogone sp. FLAS-F59071]|eukprot:RUS20172.1 hypothetical protein BC937DRAFT_86242 [Endogone sp. FLAS-F59071]